MDAQNPNSWPAGEELHRWLRAEQEGRDGDAERALAGMFRALPLDSPTAGFAHRVVAATGLRPRTRTMAWGRVLIRQLLEPDGDWRLRAASASVLTLAALTFTFLVPLMFGILRLVSPSEATVALTQGAAGFVERLAAVGLPLWDLGSRVSQALWTVAATPQVLTALVCGLLMASLALRGLIELVPDQRPGHRSFSHASF